MCYGNSLKKWMICSISGFFLYVPCIYAQSYPITGKPVAKMRSFDQAFVRFLKKWKMPGASVAIIKKDRLVFSRGYGLANKQLKQPISPNALFRVASVSKAITAVTVLKLIQMGRLRFNDSVFKILDNVTPLAGRKKNKGIYRITVKDLLQISSGWGSRSQGRFDPMFGPWPHYFTRHLSVKPPVSCYTTARLMITMPMQYQPGEKQSYINLDYCLLGLLINKVTNATYSYSEYQDYVISNILNPIGISDMRIGSTRLSNRAKNEVYYYNYPKPIPSKNKKKKHKKRTKKKKVVLPKPKSSPYLPYSKQEILKKNFADAGWLASAPDLAKFAYALSRGKIIPYRLLRQMLAKPRFLKPEKKHYFAMGFKVDNIKSKRYWIMTGSFTGTNAYVMKKPNGTVIAILFNSRVPSYSHFEYFRPQLKKLLLSKKMRF